MIETLPVHHLSRVVSLLNRGEIVAFPTGTTYGLAVNAMDPAALERLTDLKGRSKEKAYTLLLPEKGAETYVEMTEQEHTALQAFRDRPLTLLVKPRAPLLTLAKDGRVGVRTADHPFTRELTGLLSFPVTATSANRSGAEPASSIADLLTMFKDATFMAVDGGTLPKHKPSTIARWADGRWEILREGDLRLKELSRIS